MTTQSDIDNITALFRTKPENLPRISTKTEKPTYTTIKKFQDKLIENAMSIPSFTTDLGHLALVIKESDFTTANNGTAFVPPPNPGNTPAMPTFATRRATTTRTTTRGTTTTTAATQETPSQTSQAEDNFKTAEAIRLFQHRQTEYIKFRTTRTALKNCIINSVDDRYIVSLKNTITGYANVTPNDIMKHLWKKYGKIDTSDLSANEARMKTAWHPPTSIEVLFEQLKDGQDFAKQGGETINDSTIVRFGYEIIKATGLFDRDCTKWRKRESTATEWDDFVDFFTIANDDREKNSTAEEASYTANQVQQIIQQELAAFVQQDIQHQPQQPAANSAFTLDDIKTLINNAINNKPSSKPSSKQQQPKAQGLVDGIPVSYCHTHGITKNLRHTSASCTRPKEGHKKEATLDNKMGGNTCMVVPRKNS
jgi:hypothetical protein